MYSHITSEDPEIVKEASGIIADYLRTLDIRALLRLSDDFRQTTSLMWSIDWSRTDITKIEQIVANEETFLWLMRLGTFHPNGYFRERCTWRLRSDPPSYMYILLRLNDWVDQVCDCAKEALNDFSQMTLDDLMMCLFAMEKLRRCERLNIFTYREIKEKLAKRLRELTPVIEKAQMLRYDDMTRRACYRLLLEQQCLSADEIRGILSWEPHPQCQILLISMYLSYGDISEEELDEFLTHKSLIVRRFALERKYDLTGKPWAGMEDMLLSPSASIRSDVRYILRKHTDMDFRSYYLEHLGRQDARITVKKICILGLAETGKPEDADLLRDYLSENNAGITKNTLHALGSLRASDFHEVFWKYLQDERTPIMVQAYREIASHNIRYGGKKIYDLFIETSSEHLRKKLAYLLNAENYWDRIPYILMLYNYEIEDVRHILRRGTRSPSSSFGATKERLDLIAGILDDEKYDLPEQLKKSVRFNLKVAGI
ncbi:MAG: hypothetical protein J5636_05935 [Clostridiales bacterium]|nr:hypothetical protein [Clostridiales bacterium]